MKKLIVLMIALVMLFAVPARAYRVADGGALVCHSIEDSQLVLDQLLRGSQMEVFKTMDFLVQDGRCARLAPHTNLIMISERVDGYVWNRSVQYYYHQVNFAGNTSRLPWFISSIWIEGGMEAK